MRKIGLGAAWLVTLLVGTLLLSGWLGWLDMERALELVMGTVALGGLWLVVWLPWDLFFAARALAVEQERALGDGAHQQFEEFGIHPAMIGASGWAQADGGPSRSSTAAKNAGSMSSTSGTAHRSWRGLPASFTRSFSVHSTGPAARSTAWARALASA